VGAGRPRNADSEATRALILEGALEAFASAGYEGASVRELTRRLGVSHNLVHHYFGSKEKLWRAAIDYALGEKLWGVIERLDDLGEHEDPFEALDAALRSFVMLVARLPSVPRILALESAEEGPRLDYIYARYFAQAVGVATRLLDRIAAAGGACVDPRSFVLFVGIGASAPFSHASVARRLGGPDPFSEAGIRTHADAVIQLVMSGLRPVA